MYPDSPPLKTFVRSHTVAGAAVYTDEASAYRSLENHEFVTHGVGEYVRGQISINGLESFWSMLKRGIMGVFHHLSAEHLQRYVDEFETRHNTRDMDTADQMAAMVRGSEGKQLRYRDLVENGVRANR
jgi:transposase-like protein